MASTDPQAPTGPAEWSIGSADAAGDVLLFVDPTALYYVTAMALNTGWPNPTSVGDDGTTFHNADETLLLLGADIEEGTTFGDSEASWGLKSLCHMGAPRPTGPGGARYLSNTYQRRPDVAPPLQAWTERTTASWVPK